MDVFFINIREYVVLDVYFKNLKIRIEILFIIWEKIVRNIWNLSEIILWYKCILFLKFKLNILGYIMRK